MAERGDGARGGGLGFLGWLFGFVISTMSIATLVRQDFVTLSPPIEAVLNAYNNIVGIAFSPIEPWVRTTVHSPVHGIGVDGRYFELQPFWRHVFLLWIAFFLAAWRLTSRTTNRSAGFVILFVVFVSLVGSIIASSALPGDDARNQMFWAAFGALLASFGTVEAVEEILDGDWGRALIGLFLPAGGALYPFATPPPLPFLWGAGAFLGVFVIIMALSHLALASIVDLFRSHSGEPPSARVWARWRWLKMLSPFLGAASLFAIDAAPKLAQ